MSMPKILVGCDPELFVRNTETGKFVAPYQMIPGDKTKPHPVPDGAIQVDGMAVEFNIEPASSLEKWRGKIQGVRAALKAALPAGHELVTIPTADFDPDYWHTLPKEALEIGCVPDYNVYTGQENPRPDGGAQFFRSAAGHIHIGWTKDKDITDVDHIADCVEVTKQLDFYVGVPSCIWDTDQRRRLLYGRAGSIRVKPYGLEYRTPSNMWLNSTAATDFVYQASIAAVTDLFNDNALRTKFNEGWAAQYINGQRKTTRDTLYALGQYSNMLQKAGIYLLPENTAPKPKPKPVKIALDIDGVVADADFRWRGLRMDQLDADMIPMAVRDLEAVGDPGRHIPALMGLRDRLRGNRGGWRLQPDPMPVVIRGEPAGQALVDEFFAEVGQANRR